MVERVYSPMLDRQQRDELGASLQSVGELWENAASINVPQNYTMIKNTTSSG